MPGEPLVLGVDTCTPRSGIALAAGGVVRARVDFDGLGSPSRRLLPSIRFALEMAGVELLDLAGLAVTVGPGSFTGIRVGLSTVRGLALGAGLPVTGVSTLAALAGTAGPDERPIAAWLDAGRDEVYAGLYRVEENDVGHPAPEIDEVVAPPDAVLERLPTTPVRFAGSGAVRWADRIRQRRATAGDRIERRPLFLAGATALLGAVALAGGTPAPVEPRYLRPPDALRARGA